MSTRLPPVLVVDDEKNMRLSLKTVLADEKYSVRAIESAEEAIDTNEAGNTCGATVATTL